MPYKYHESVNIYDKDAIARTVQSMETQFTIVNGKISSLITDTELATLRNGGTTMFNRMYTMEQTVDGLSSTVSSLRTSLENDYPTTVEMQSAITQKANEITLAVSQTLANYSTTQQMNSAIQQSATSITSTVNQTLTSYPTRTDLSNTLRDYATVSAMNSAITQKANEITLAVSTTYATKADAVTSAVVQYAVGTSSTTAPTSGWSADSPTWTAGKYIWQRTAITKNGSTTYSNVACIQGAKGETGSTGKGISSITNYYLASASGSDVTRETAGWTTTIQTTTATKKYLWNYEIITYTDNSTSNTVPCIIGTYGATGDAGKGISSIVEYYAVNNSTTAPADSAFSTAVKSPTGTNKYLWNYELVTYTDSTTNKTGKRIIGTYGETGDTGVGVKAVKPQYYLSTSNTTQTGGSWSDTPPTWSDGKYLWTRTHTTYTDNTTKTSTPVLDNVTNGLEQRMTAAELKITDSAIVSTVTSSQGFNNSVSSLIEQNASSIRLQASKISWTSDNSSMTAAGVLTCTGATISGKVTATTGKIGPWNITSTAIYKTSSTWGSSASGAAYFGNNGISITDKFKVSEAGAMTSTSGDIGNWIIDPAKGFRNTDSSVFLSASLVNATVPDEKEQKSVEVQVLARFGSVSITNQDIRARNINANNLSTLSLSAFAIVPNSGTLAEQLAALSTSGTISVQENASAISSSYSGRSAVFESRSCDILLKSAGNIRIKDGNDTIYDLINSCWRANKITIENDGSVNLWGPKNHLYFGNNGDLYVTDSVDSTRSFSLLEHTFRRHIVNEGAAYPVKSGRLYVAFFYHPTSVKSSGIFIFVGGSTVAQPILMGSGSGTYNGNIYIELTTTSFTWSDANNNPTCYLYY